MSGPLTSLRVVEFTGLGPAPLAGQVRQWQAAGALT
jgi:crotonobetainyl-CoA:carnitine CoA-transferase CaiB-like acyl-CoA transferase